MLRELTESWKDNRNIFLVEGARAISYDQLWQDLSTRTVVLNLKERRNQCIAVVSHHTYETYVTVLAILQSANTLILVPEFQFEDSNYRNHLVDELGVTTLFLEKDFKITTTENLKPNSRFQQLNPQGSPCFIVRTSGSSSSRYKFILHSVEKFCGKYLKRGRHFDRTLAFSPLESIAGTECLLETVVVGASLVAGGDKMNPDLVSQLLQSHSVDYFQTTPTFLNLMLVAKKISGSTFSSVKKIAYGSEPAALPALNEIKNNFPAIELNHTYGMSEIGIQITHTNPTDPTEFRLDELNSGRIHCGLVEVKSLVPMLGYINSEENPATAEGWFKTGDRVNENGDYWRILGRATDLLNVAGRKFFPSDVEAILLEMPGIGDAIVIGQKNELIGQSLMVKILLSTPEEELAFRKRFKKFCEERLPYFMHPQRVELIDEKEFHRPEGSRFKKMRRL